MIKIKPLQMNQISVLNNPIVVHMPLNKWTKLYVFHLKILGDVIYIFDKIKMLSFEC